MEGVLDADTHIAESDHMWALFDKEMYPRRPVRVQVPDDTLYGDSNAFWLIDGNIFPKPAGKGGFRLITPSTAKRQTARDDLTIASREITDPNVRLRDMDDLGVRTQVIYPTLFLIYLTDDVDLQVALCRAYNEWLAKVWAADEERFKWVAILPLGSIEAALAELRKDKDKGATGVFFRGMEGSRTLDDPYFFPIYEEAEKLDLAICVHTGSGSPELTNMFTLERNHTFVHSRALPMFAFRDLVHNAIPELFPKLRFGFLEASASWAPFIVHTLQRLMKSRWKFSDSRDLFEEYRLFITCEADEDIPYLTNIIGEDKLIIGSDYGHNDPTNEPQLVQTLTARSDMSEQLCEKILCKNPRTLYGL